MKTRIKKFYPDLSRVCPRERSRLQASRAFTLIEMLIVLFIFSVVIAISTVLYVQIIRYNILAGERRKVNQEARNVMETIAREAEIAQGTSNLTPALPALLVSDAGADGIGHTLVINSSNYRLETMTARTNPPSQNKTITLSRKDYGVEPSREASPLDIMLVLDNTSSMWRCANGVGSPDDTDPPCAPKIQKLEDAANHFVDLMMGDDPLTGDPSPHQIGLVTYANHVLPATHPLTQDPTGIQEVKNLIDSMDSQMSEGTNICEAISNGNSYFSRPEARSDAKKIVVFFSDGAANCPCCTQWACSVLTDPEGRAECEAAVASGEVRICPPGDPLFTDSCVWDWRCSQDLCGGPPPAGSGYENNPRGKAQYQASLGRDPGGITYYSIGIGSRLEADPNFDLDPLTLGHIADCPDETLDLNAENEGRDPVVTCDTYLESNNAEALDDFFSGLAEGFWVNSRTGGDPTPDIRLTSSDVMVVDAEFQMSDTDDVQPWLRIKIKVSNRIQTPDWRHVEVTLETIISSRDYIYPPSPPPPAESSATIDLSGTGGWFDNYGSQVVEDQFTDPLEGTKGTFTQLQMSGTIYNDGSSGDSAANATVRYFINGQQIGYSETFRISVGSSQSYSQTIPGSWSASDLNTLYVGYDVSIADQDHVRGYFSNEWARATQ